MRVYVRRIDRGKLTLGAREGLKRYLRISREWWHIFGTRLARICPLLRANTPAENRISRFTWTYLVQEQAFRFFDNHAVLKSVLRSKIGNAISYLRYAFF